MKSLFMIITALFVYTNSFGQSDSASVTLNTLKAPSSPAGFLLGLNAVEIPVFSDKTKLAAEISNKTNGYSTLPKSFAFDIAPLLIFRKENKDSVSSKNLNRNWLLSFGYKDSTELNVSKFIPSQAQLALGTHFQFNVKRKNNYKANNQKSNFNEKPSNSFTNISKAKLKDPNPRDFLYTEGIKIAISGGLVYNQKNSSLDHSAGWVAFGSHFSLDTLLNNAKKENQYSWIIMTKFQNNSEASETYMLTKEKNQTLVGGKISLNYNKSTRYYIDLEGLYKKATFTKTESILIKNVGQFKFDGSFGVELAKNFVLSATIGKDFGSQIFNKSGSLFALLNIAGGLGRTKRDV